MTLMTLWYLAVHILHNLAQVCKSYIPALFKCQHETTP